MARVRVYGVSEFRFAASALKSVDADLRRRVNSLVRKEATAIWRDETGQSANRQDARFLTRNASVASSPRGVTLTAGKGTTLTGERIWRQVEFGDGHKTTETTTQPVYGRRPKQPYKRHTQNQLPARHKSGRVIYPAVARSAPRLMALWAATAIRTVREAWEGK